MPIDRRRCLEYLCHFPNQNLIALLNFLNPFSLYHSPIFIDSYMMISLRLMCINRRLNLIDPGLMNFRPMQKLLSLNNSVLNRSDCFHNYYFFIMEVPSSPSHYTFANSILSCILPRVCFNISAKSELISSICFFNCIISSSFCFQVASVYTTMFWISLSLSFKVLSRSRTVYSEVWIYFIISDSISLYCLYRSLVIAQVSSFIFLKSSASWTSSFQRLFSRSFAQSSLSSSFTSLI